ncbi:MAG: nucleotidyltransferase domain-containing protein, partial [Nanoarchaeota archaeon]
DKILRAQIKEISLRESELLKIKNETEEIAASLGKAIKRKKIRADVFVGGSLAKGTILRRERYDIDIFVRFDRKYEEKKISGLLGSLIGRAERIHGSRDYFQIKKGRMTFELIPVVKISKPKEMRNVTDLSYFHVSYIKKMTGKKRGLIDEILLAKSFAFSQGVYGAESYINGFSGYALELLVCHYGSFLAFIRAMAKSKKDKIILDPEKHYKNSREVLSNMNEAKLESPIVFVDPTFKERNVLAALSEETFARFKNVCRKFLAKPSLKFFRTQEIKKKNFNFILQAETNKQEGNIAGSKLLKFYKFTENKLKIYFIIEGSEFEYLGGKGAVYYFKLKKRKEIIREGPPLAALENVTAFRKKHKKTFVRKGRVYAREKVKLNARSFIKKFKIENKEVMKNMGIVGLSSA